jgi:hypothetical protein
LSAPRFVVVVDVAALQCVHQDRLRQRQLFRYRFTDYELPLRTCNTGGIIKIGQRLAKPLQRATEQ